MSGPEKTSVKFALSDASVNRRRGGEIRVVLSPGTVDSTTGFMGHLTLAPGEYVSEHYHPYSEEFFYVEQGEVVILLDGEQEIELGHSEGMVVPKKTRHRVENRGTRKATALFHLCPLAPRPDLGHVDTEAYPDGTGLEETGRA